MQFLTGGPRAVRAGTGMLVPGALCLVNAEQSIERVLCSGESLFGDEHRSGFARRLRDEAGLVQPVESLPVEALPYTLVIMEPKQHQRERRFVDLGGVYGHTRSPRLLARRAQCPRLAAIPLPQKRLLIGSRDQVTENRVTSRKTLNAPNLEALGATRLAALLIEISTGNAAAKRRLRLELAGTASAADAAGEIAKRLASIAKAKTFLDWRKVKPLAADVHAQHRAILEHVAASDPRGALDLLWRLVATADRVLARTDDGSGHLMAVFRRAVQDLAPLAAAAEITSEALAEMAFEVLRDDSYGQWEGLVDRCSG